MSARALAGAAAAAALLAGCGSGSGGLRTTATVAVQPPGVVILVPGSGFKGASAGVARAMRLPAAVWRAWGLRTRVAAYRAGPTGLADVGAVLGAVHTASPRAPVCLYGESSGGTWALVVAAHDPRVRCVIVSAAPTDDETWARAGTRAAQTLARRIWPGYFGPRARDDAFEPYDVWRALRPRVPVLGLYAQGDPVVPAQQGRIFAAVVPSARISVLRRGARSFIHSGVTARGLRGAIIEVRRFVLAHDSR